MALPCKITIDSVNVYGSPGQPVSSVTVEGTATNCAGGYVHISCGGRIPIPEGAFQTIAQDVPVPWSVEFSNLSGSGCICGAGFMRVYAYCKVNQDTCNATWPTLSPPQCQPPKKDCCPTVSIEATEGACDLQGRRIVKFKVTTTPATDPGCPDTVFAQLDFGDEMLGAGFVVPPDSVWIETHPYVPGSYTAKVHIIAPLGCPDIPVKVGPLVECPPGCPGPNDITVAVDDCDAEGRRIVSVDVLLPGSGSTTVSVDWQDGTPPDSNLPIQGGVHWTGWHHYLPPGPYKVTVSVAGCPPITKPVGPLPPCNGGNGNGHPCPWWNPFCKGCNLCAAILAFALLNIITAGVVFMVWACKYHYPYVLYVALAAAATGLIALGIWYALCRHLPTFCDTLKGVLDLLAYIMYIQTIIIAILVALAAIPGSGVTWFCVYVGAVGTWGYYGAVYFWLTVINSQAHCPPYNPPTLPSQALTSKGINRVRHD